MSRLSDESPVHQYPYIDRLRSTMLVFLHFLSPPLFLLYLLLLPNSTFTYRDMLLSIHHLFIVFNLCFLSSFSFFIFFYFLFFFKSQYNFFPPEIKLLLNTSTWLVRLYLTTSFPLKYRITDS